MINIDKFYFQFGCCERKSFPFHPSLLFYFIPLSYWLCDLHYFACLALFFSLILLFFYFLFPQFLFFFLVIYVCLFSSFYLPLSSFLSFQLFSSPYTHMLFYMFICFFSFYSSLLSYFSNSDSTMSWCTTQLLQSWISQIEKSIPAVFMLCSDEWEMMMNSTLGRCDR
jgi:hypothetical protein